MFSCIKLSKLIHHSNNLSMTSIRLKWHLVSAVCLQRMPVVTPQMNWLEQKIYDLMKIVEANRSLYSDHELRHFEDLKRAERIANGQKLDDKDLDAASKQTAQDFEDAANQELKQFILPPRLTIADETNDTKSLTRCYDRRLVLICNQKLGQKNYWLFPQAVNVDGENLRQTAERALSSAIGQNIKVKFLGNVPRAVYIYKYPKPIAKQENAEGAKVFVFKANYQSGQVEINNELVSDYQWLNTNELSKTLHKHYWQSISKCFLEENGIDIDELMQRSRKFRRIVQKKITVSQ